MTFRTNLQSFVRWLMLVMGVLTIASLVGCVSYYNSSLFGHDETYQPLIRNGTTSGQSKLSTSIQYTDVEAGTNPREGMRAGQAALLFDATKPMVSGDSALDLGLSAMGYYAGSTVDLQGDHQTSTYTGSGFALQARPGILWGGKDAGEALAYLKFIYCKEFGDYLDARDRYLEPITANTGRINEGPHGSTFTTFMGAQGQVPFSKDFALDLVGEFGFGNTDWPRSDKLWNAIPLWDAAFILSYQKFWFYAGYQALNVLNSGYAVGLGYDWL